MLHYHFLLSQVKKHSAYLMTIEMSIVGSLCLFVSMTKSPDGEAIRKFGFFHDWTSLTLEIWELMDVAATQEHLVEA
ncbi:unnamed protein product [Linum trigynum]|uniref:Uncharacterized protein n=1 Tax=Linum trigynum TaxID=586398 RepID=A0AAV2E1F5_9ROSI